MSACGVPRCGSSSAVRGHGVCDDCWDRRGRVLDGTLALWQDLHGHLGQSQRGMSEALSRPAPGPRPPLNGAVLELLQAVPALMLGWANVCRTVRDQPALTTGGKRWGYVLQEALGTLAATDEELHYQHYAVEYLTDVFSAHTRMVQLAGMARLVHRLHAACPECGRRELVRHNGTETVLCARCGSRWSLVDYDRKVAIEAAAIRREGVS